MSPYTPLQLVHCALSTEHCSIKTVLLDLPSIVDSGQVKLPPGGRKAPQSYTKLVIKGHHCRGGWKRSLLKYYFRNDEDGDGFESCYVTAWACRSLCRAVPQISARLVNILPAGVLIHDFSYPEPDLSELSKLLDMKGVKRSEQSNILELYKEQQKRAAVEEEKTGGWFLYSIARYDRSVQVPLRSRLLTTLHSGQGSASNPSKSDRQSWLARIHFQLNLLWFLMWYFVCISNIAGLEVS